MRSRETRLVSEAAVSKRDLAVAERALEKLTLENEVLARFQPEDVLRELDHEERDQNRRRQISIADGYMNHHRDTFARACRILAEHHLSLYEEGADALERARAAAMGALAAAPGDRDLAMLLSEIEALQRVEATPPATQEEARQREERHRLQRLLREAPGDFAALRAVGQNEYDAGRYRTAIVIWERAKEALLADGDGGSDDPAYLELQLNLGWATLNAGRLKPARAIIAPLPDLCSSATTPTDTITPDGWPNCSKEGLRELLPLVEEARGKEHPVTLTTRHFLAVAIHRQSGREAEAEELLRELLPLEEKVKGEEHPDTLTTRYALAVAIRDQSGREAEAEELLRELLPVEEKVKGKEHPDTLTTRYALAVAIRDQSGRARPRNCSASPSG